MTAPVAWLVEAPGERPFAVFSAADAAHFQRPPAWNVTPLIAAPPAGAPTWLQLANALKVVNEIVMDRVTEPFLNAAERRALTRARALLSRLPQRQEGTDR